MSNCGALEQGVMLPNGRSTSAIFPGSLSQQSSGRLLGVEWCEAGRDGPWAACEAWVITQREWVETAGKYMDITYYLKFAISRTGSILLMASNHPENT